MPAEVRSLLLRQITENAYRVLGLPADASSRAITERALALQRAAKAGISRPSPWNLDWYGPLRRDQAAISDALGRLSNPRQRLKERLFWIAQSEIFVNISIQKLDVSVESLRSSHSSQDRHDVAIVALIACFLNNPTVTDPERWKKMLELWVDALGCEDFWSEFMDAEHSGDFEPAAMSEDLDELRADSFTLITETIAELARDAAARKDFNRCGRALRVLRAAKLPVEVISAVEEDVLGHYEDALSRLSQDIRMWVVNHVQQDRSSAHLNEEPSALAVSRWKNELEPKYNDLVAMAGLDSLAGLWMSQDYSRLLENLGYARGWANKWADAEMLLTEACKHLTSQSPAWERIEENLRDFAKSAAQQRLGRQSQAEEGSQRNLSFRAAGTDDEASPEAPAQSDEKSNEEAIWIQQARNLAGFCDLCSSLQSKCWEAFAVRYASSETQRLAVLMAWNEYKCKVKPWLNLILASYGQDANIIEPIQNAAAACLSSLARGFLLANDLDSAHNLAIEARALVIAHGKLLSEIEACLDRISSEKRRSTRAPHKIKPPLSTEETVDNEHASSLTNSQPAGSSWVVKRWRSHASRLAAVMALGLAMDRRWRSHALKLSMITALIIAVITTSIMRRAAVGQRPEAVTDLEVGLRADPAHRSENPPHTDTSFADSGARMSMPKAVDFSPASKYGLNVFDTEPSRPVTEAVLVTPSRAVVLDTRKSREPVSLSNGKNLIDPGDITGLGQLTISNHSRQDAVIKLKPISGVKATLRLLYVRAMNDVTISGISAGNYLLRIKQGNDWDSKRLSFREHQTFGQIETSLSFSEDQIIHYSGTLHPASHGNTRIRSITAAEFDN